MLILFFGTAVYNGSVPWLLFPSSSSLEYEKVEEGEEGGEGGGRRTRAHSIEDFAPVIRTEPSMVRTGGSEGGLKHLFDGGVYGWRNDELEEAVSVILSLPPSLPPSLTP